MARVAYISCPQCSQLFYVYSKDYIGNPEALCHCPFCSNNFHYVEGRLKE